MKRHKSKRRLKNIISRRELLLCTLCLTIIALAVIWYINYDASSTTTRISTATPIPSAKIAQPTNPYLGWKTYAIPKSNLSFKYPSNWQLSPTVGPFGPWASPGTPETSLTSPSGLYVDILTDQHIQTSEAGNIVLHATPINTLGTTCYIDYIDAIGDNSVSYATLLTGSQATSAYPTILMPSGNANRLIISVAYQAKGGAAERPLTFYMHDPAMAQAVLLIESLSN